MDLLDVVRGPGLVVSAAVFVLGTGWRLLGVLRMPARPDLSPARAGAPGAAVAAGRSILRGLWPRREYRTSTALRATNAYVMHVALALVCLGYAPHIAFVRRSIGLGWPALPDAVTFLAAAAALGSLMLALAARLSDPVLQTISDADDHISWTLVALPFVTGMAVVGEPSAGVLARDHALYRGPLALHLLSFELLLLWFPFGKLMHAVLYPLSRAATGMRYGRRGVAS